MARTNDKILAKKREFGQIIHRLSEFYDSQTRLLVKHLYDKGYSYQDVANILDISKQAVFDKFPKEVSL
jgi:predicted DNA-binding protein YlxM (UPF0122 family)